MGYVSNPELSQICVCLYPSLPPGHSRVLYEDMSVGSKSYDSEEMGNLKHVLLSQKWFGILRKPVWIMLNHISTSFNGSVASPHIGLMMLEAFLWDFTNMKFLRMVYIYPVFSSITFIISANYKRTSCPYLNGRHLLHFVLFSTNNLDSVSNNTQVSAADGWMFEKISVSRVAQSRAAGCTIVSMILYCSVASMVIYGLRVILIYYCHTAAINDSLGSLKSPLSGDIKAQ